MDNLNINDKSKVINREEYYNSIIPIIKEILDVPSIEICYIFGSILTDSFNFETSDIDIAVLGDLDLLEVCRLNNRLEESLGRKIDLVELNDINKIIKVSIASKGEILFCKDEVKLYSFLKEVDDWVIEDYDFYSMCRRDYFYGTN